MGSGAGLGRGGYGKKMKTIRSGSSFCSASDVRLLYGLAGGASPVNVSVTWPSGKKCNYGSLRPDGYYLLSEDGEAQSDPRLDRSANRETPA